MGSVGNTVSTIIGDAQNKVVDRIANRTRNLKNEQYRIINENGDIVLERKGNKNSVAGTVGEKRQFMEGGIGIHNHPDGGTFSYDDLRDFGFGARQIVVASPEGDYKLTNIKYGQFDARSGWRDMQDAMEKAGLLEEQGFLSLRRIAEKTPRVMKLSQKVKSISDQWLQARNAGKSEAELQKYVNEFNKYNDQYKIALREETRRAEVQPYHDWYRKNARKYGFEYTFTKRKR